MQGQLETVKKFFTLIEQFSTEKSEFEAILHPGIEQTEFPNAMTKEIRVQGFEEILAGAQAGKKILTRQSIEIRNTITAGEALIVEATWTGEMAMDAGNLKKGQTLRAYICFIFEFRDGKIFRQRNYDCYETVA